MRLLAIGYMTVDEIRHGSRRVVAPGGASFYVAATASSLGAKTSIVSTIGPDYPLRVLRWLEQKRIGIGAVDRSSDQTTRFRLDYAPSGKRTLSLLRMGDLVPSQEIKGRADIVHLGPVMLEINNLTLQLARRVGRLVSLDVQGLLRSVQRSGKIKLRHHDLDRFLNECDVVKAAKDEAEILTGSKDPIEMARGLASKGPDYAIVSLGTEGLVASNGKRSWKIPAYPESKVKDATGAGDAMVAGWLVSFWRTKDPLWASAVGSAVSSMIIRQTGLSKFHVSGPELLRRAAWVYQRIETFS